MANSHIALRPANGQEIFALVINKHLLCAKFYLKHFTHTDSYKVGFIIIQCTCSNSSRQPPWIAPTPRNTKTQTVLHVNVSSTSVSILGHSEGQGEPQTPTNLK